MTILYQPTIRSFQRGEQQYQWIHFDPPPQHIDLRSVGWVDDASIAEHRLHLQPGVYLVCSVELDGEVVVSHGTPEVYGVREEFVAAYPESGA